MNKRIPIILGILLVAIALWMLLLPTKFVQQLFDRLDHLGYDLQLRTRVLTQRPSLTTPIAIIDIDDKSLSAEGRWPWPRDKVAQLVNELSLQGAAVIAFDMFFAEPEFNIADILLKKLSQEKLLTTNVEETLKKTVPFFDTDATFAKALQNLPSILAMGFLPKKQAQNILPKPVLTITKQEQIDLDITNAEGYISNIPILQNAAKGGGFINIFPDSDGIIRRSPLLIEYAGGLYPALSLQVVMTFLGEDIKLVTHEYGDSKELEGIALGPNIIPTDGSAQVLIPFIGKSYTFPFYSATDVLHKQIPKDALAGKILFIGTSATGSGDLKATAIENPFPGVEVQATLTNGLLLNNFSYKPLWTFGANFLLTIFLGLIAAFLFPYFGPRTLSLVVILLPPALLLLNNWIWQATGLILSFLIPALLVLTIAILNIIYGYLFETRRREHLKEMFGQYVPAKHIDEMLKSKSNYALQGEDRDMTVLFADIRNFTSISEGMLAADLVDMLNTFFNPMTEIIFKNQGTIDKYVGDLIMAFWGAPLRDKNHARNAIQSALEMQRKMRELKSTIAEHHWPEFKIGIGINSGLMSVGDMGSRFRRNYTVLGDAVNIASRIESLTKHYGVDIIVTEYSEHKQEQKQQRFVFRKLDKVRVKGKSQGVEIFEVVCFYNELTPTLTKELELYQTGYAAYQARLWDESLNIMTQLHHLHPKAKLYKIYMQRLNTFIKNPPPDDWDGVYTHQSK